MITEDFTIKGLDRFNEFKDFMKTQFQAASFRFTPVFNSNTNSCEVSIRYPLDQASLLDQLHAKWKLEDGENAKQNQHSTYNLTPMTS